MRVHKHGRSLTDGTHRTTGLEEVAFTEPVPWVDLCCYSIYGVDRCRWSVRVQWTLQGGRQVQVPPMVGLSFVGAVELVTEVNKGRQGLSFPISDVYPERLRGGRGYFRRTKLMIIFQMYLGFCRTLGELPSWQPDAYIYIYIYTYIYIHVPVYLVSVHIGYCRPWQLTGTLVIINAPNAPRHSPFVSGKKERKKGISNSNVSQK